MHCCLSNPGTGRSIYYELRRLYRASHIQDIYFAPVRVGWFINCTRDAQASIRVTGPASVTGQAIGTAAVLSMKEKVIPRQLDIKLLQRELKRAGVFLG